MNAHQFGNYSKNPSEPSYYGGIYVKLDQDTLTPGQVLSGKIYLDLITAYPGDKICLAVKGSELAKWIDREHRQRQKPDGTMESYYVDVPREGSIDIIKQDLDIYDWQKGAIIPKGQYTFPFQFKLPQGAPGSFFMRSGTTLGEIKYSVEGYLKPEKESVPKLKHKLLVVVRENPTINAQTKEVSISKTMTTWCCCNQGTVSMRTAFEKNAYAPGEEARIITEIDNTKCSLGIPGVYFSLNQNVSLSTGSHGRGFNFNIQSINLGRIEAGQSCLGEQRKEAAIVLPPGQEGRSKDYKEGEEVQFDPKTFITPSAHGKLVKSDYSLMVSCATEGCLCCDSAPLNHLPILVYAQAPQKQPELIPPPNWQPQQMPAANLTVIITNTPGGGTEIRIQQGNPDPQSMVGNSMPPQNLNQPNQMPQQPQPQFQQQPQYPPQQQQQYPPQQYPPQQQQQYPPQQQQQYPPQQQQYPPQQYPPQQQQYPPQQLQAQPVQIGQNQQYPNQY